jgi:dTDP-4-amino-4,6-dideoxygalactose transaminase
VAEVVRDAEVRFGHKIWIIQDCAHAFGACWQGQLVCGTGDAALFGLNISKTITSIFGGMLTTDSAGLARKLREFREAHFRNPPAIKWLRRLVYLALVYPAFNPRVYRLVQWLERETPLIDGVTKAYHLDGVVDLPPDYLDRMLNIEAAVGMVQLHKYADIVERQRQHARYYNDHVRAVRGWILPPLRDGATYSHYVVRVENRERILAGFRRRGIHLGRVIDYSIPDMPAYLAMARGQEFPRSRLASQTVVNLPISAALSEHEIGHVAATTALMAA